MKNLNNIKGPFQRVPLPPIMGGGMGNEFGGAFRGFKNGVRLLLIAANGDGWDHISVRTEHRAPTWGEMEFVKRAFFYDHEVAYQLHVGTGDHINIHPDVLHIWRPHDKEIPIPPKIMV